MYARVLVVSRQAGQPEFDALAEEDRDHLAAEAAYGDGGLLASPRSLFVRPSLIRQSPRTALPRPITEPPIRPSRKLVWIERGPEGN